MPLRLSGARRDQASTPPAVRPRSLRLLAAVAALIAVVASEFGASWSGGMARFDIVVLATLLRELRTARLRVLVAVTALVASWAFNGATWATTGCVVISLAVSYAVAWVLTPGSVDVEALPSRRFVRITLLLLGVVAVGSLAEAGVSALSGTSPEGGVVTGVFTVALPLLVSVLAAGLVAARVILDRGAAPYASRLAGAFAALALAGVAVQLTLAYWVASEAQTLDTASTTVSASLQQAIAADLNSFAARAATVPRTPVDTQVAFDRSVRSFLYGNPTISAVALLEGQAGVYRVVYATDRQGSAPEIGGTLGGAAADAPALDAAAATSAVMLLGVRDVPGADATPAPNFVYVSKQAVPDGDPQRFLAVALSIPVSLEQATVSLGSLRQNLALVLTEQVTDTNPSPLVLAQVVADGAAPDDAAMARAARSETMFGDIPLDLAVTPGPGFGVPRLVRGLVLGGLLLLGLLGAALVLQAANARQRASHDREEREALLEAALDAAPGLVLLVDGADRVMVSNDDGSGFRKVGTPILDALPFGTEGRGGDDVRELIARGRAGEAASIEHVDTSSAADLRILRVSVTPVRARGARLVVQVEDVTGDRARAMRSAQAERLRSLGTMAGGLAHDFNNLLFIITGYLQMLREDDAVADHERLLRYVDRASDAAERGAEIASSLLSVARSQPLEATAVEVGSFLTRLFPLVHQAVGTDRVAELVLGDGPLDVLVDSGQLSGSVLNLAINARDAMELGGTLSIGVERQHVDDPDLDVPAGEYVVITVVDDGCGMSVDTLERAFEPYFSTKGAGHGTGIGLAAVYSFARQSGGIATISSVRDLGTTVSLYLPAVFARERDEIMLSPVGRPPTRRVLVVDDESSLAGLIAGWLTEQGAEVRVAETPTQALRIARDFSPDVLLTDVRLGDPDGIDGPTLATQVEGVVPGVAVVFMTGFSDRMHDLQAMGMHTLAKPFTKDALGQVIFPLASTAALDDGGAR